MKLYIFLPIRTLNNLIHLPFFSMCFPNFYVEIKFIIIMGRANAKQFVNILIHVDGMKVLINY